MITSVTDLETWLSATVDHERNGTFRDIRIERFRAFLALLPPCPAPCTVGGTKGKGSTVRLIEAALRAHGLRTLAFTSPHVRSVRERWRLDGVPASIAELAPACAVVAEVERRSGVALTYFERTAAIAVVLAATIPACSVLWEVGLGGRLDCANALDCQVAVITHLSHDHRDVLGPTLDHIAAEKLPIARPGRPLLIAPQTPAAAAALTTQVALMPSLGPVTWIHRHADPFALSLAGTHQHDNASTALAAAKLMYPPLDEALARSGMAHATLAARCQKIRRGERTWLIDGAHNGPSIAATLAVAHACLRPGWQLVIGTATDKEIDEITAVLPTGIRWHRCGYDSPRARGRDAWPNGWQHTPWHADIGTLLSQVSDVDLCITGSFYLAGEALRALGAEDVQVG